MILIRPLPEPSHRYFNDSVATSMKNWYFQEAASANAEAIIFLHDYVMSYLLGILVSVLVLIIYLSILFTWTNDERTIHVSFVPKGARKNLGWVLYKKWLRHKDITVLREGQPKNPPFLNTRVKTPFWVKYNNKVALKLEKLGKILFIMELIEKKLKDHKEYRKAVGKINKWYKKVLQELTASDEFGVEINYTNKYPKRKSKHEVYFTPKQKTKIDLKLMIYRIVWKLPYLLKGLERYISDKLWKISLYIKGVRVLLINVLKEKNKEIEEKKNINYIRYLFTVLGLILSHNKWKNISLREVLEREKEIFKRDKNKIFWGLPKAYGGYKDNIWILDKTIRYYRMKIELAKRTFFRGAIERVMPEVMYDLQVQADFKVFVRKYAKLILFLWKENNLFDIYRVWEKKKKGILVSPKGLEYSNFLKVENNCHNLTLELLWTLIPAIILLTIGAPSLATLYSLEEVVAPEMTVKVIGNQWFWVYEYQTVVISDLENTDPKFQPWNKGYAIKCKDIEPVSFSFESHLIVEDELLEGQLRLLEVDFWLLLPINTEIRLLVTSNDVIHSFAVPSLGIKTDGVPGRINEVPLFIKRKGLYYGQCSELCGINHAFMPIVIQTASPRLLYYMLSYTLLD